MKNHTKMQNPPTTACGGLRRILAGLVSLAITGALLLSGVWPAKADSMYTLPEGQTLYASSAMLVHLGIQPEQDVVLFEKEADTVRAPAALIRLMVGAYALDQIEEKNLDLDTTTGTYTVEMFNKYIAGTGITTTPMTIGETWTLRDLLHAALIATAGEAAVTLAATVSGSVEIFVQGMNDLAKEIGCTSTSFANVTGLDSLLQYTTARDLYKIVRYAMDFPLFETVMNNAEYTVHPQNAAAKTIITTNSMRRSSSKFFYSPLVFGRTGFTDQSGWSLVSFARDSGYEYVAIVLGCPETAPDGTEGLHYTDTKTLYKWAFSSFTYKPLLAKNEIIAHVKVDLAWNKDRVALVPKEEFATVVYNELQSDDIIKKPTLYQSEVDAPIEKGQVYGKVELFINVDQKIGEVELVASESVSKSQILAAWDQVQQFLSSPWFFAGLGVLVLLLVGYIILNIVHNHNRRKNSQKPVKRYP